MGDVQLSLSCKRAHIGVKPTDLVFAENKYGKPILINPLVKDLDFSISHSGDYVIVALNQGGKIGVDIEWDELRPSSFARRFFSQAELCSHENNHLSAQGMNMNLTRLWSRKEAVAKFLSLGSSLDFRLLDTSDDILTIDHLVTDLSIRLISNKCDGYWISLALEN